jgi:hypothetical protein
MSFIHAKKALRFWDKKVGVEHEVPAGFIGELPEWAENTYLYDLAVKDGSLTYVGERKTQVVVDAVTDATEDATNIKTKGKA